MVTVEAVLRRNGYLVSESAVAEQLEILLSPAPSKRPIVGVELSAADARFLDEHAGVRTASADQLKQLQARSVARVVAEVGKALNRSEVADRLGVDVSRVSHQATQGRLYAYSVGSRPAFPDWQFLTDGEGGPGALPNLAKIIAAFPDRSHPVTVRSFMTTVDFELTVDGERLSPRHWLISGGDPDAVVELARTLGEQV